VTLAAELDDERLSWQRTIGYCKQHKAETTIIPLGLRAGYPTDIAFMTLQDRIEERWLREEIEDIMVDPDTAPLFDSIVGTIRKMGKGKWNSMAHQTTKHVLRRTMPG